MIFWIAMALVYELWKVEALMTSCTRYVKHMQKIINQ